MSDPEKSSWPELQSKPATQAARIIAQERPDVAVEVHPPGSPVASGSSYNIARVRLFVDYNGLVANIPFIG